MASTSFKQTGNLSDAGDAQERSAAGAALEHDHEHDYEPGGGFPLGKLVLGALAVALLGWIGVRIHQKNVENAAIAAEQVRAPAAKKAPPATVHGQPASWTPTVPLDGTLEAMQQADLGFKVPGRLAGIRVKVGDLVRKGQVLATLDADEARARLEAAEAQVKVAQAQLALADDSAKRTLALEASGAAPQANGVQAREQRALVAAQLDAAQAQAAIARANVESHTLEAPFAGVVTRVPDGVGAVVNPGVPLFHLQDTGRLKLSATVGARDAALLRVGSAVRIEDESREARGTVTAVVASLDPSTRRVPVEAVVDNDLDPPLRAGSFVRAVATAPEPVPVLALPASALRPGSQDEVLVVSGGRLHLRHVVFETQRDGTLLVRSGLGRDEVVLAAPSAEARDGDPVK